jgi:mono/diheme cytochrome c family protein
VAAWAALAVAASCSGDDSPPGASESATGAELYARSCASCHGSDLRGTDRGPSHLSQVYAPDHHPDASFRAAIVQGSPAHHWDFGDMPPVGGLSDEEIGQIIAYVREQQEAHGLEPYPPR